MAGFQLTLYGRFWVTAEVTFCHTASLDSRLEMQKRFEFLWLIITGLVNGVRGNLPVEALARSASQRCLPGRPLTLSLVAVAAMEVPKTITSVCLFTWTKLILKIAITSHLLRIPRSLKVTTVGRCSRFHVV